MIRTFDKPHELFNKLVREATRSHCSKKTIEAQDNIFNFCITSHSLRDWCIKYLELDETSKNNFHNDCNSYQSLQYCRDIANASKHFSINKEKPSVNDLVSESIEMVAILPEDADIDVPNSQRISYTLHLDGDKSIMQFTFIHETLEAWDKLFEQYQIPKIECVDYRTFPIEFR